MRTIFPGTRPNPSERLAIYQLALADWGSVSSYTNKGFCYYFRKLYRLYTNLDVLFKIKLPELYNQKPAHPHSEFWFEIGTEQGRHLRRICLIAAIEEVEQLINK